MSTDTHDTTFACMGGHTRIVAEADPASDSDPRGLAAMARGFLTDFDERLSRFVPGSELCALNADPSSTVPATSLMRAWVRSALWAAKRTGGLVDPTLGGELAARGYAGSRARTTPADLRLALTGAPGREPARPHPHAAWRKIEVDDAARTITRPPGMTLDSGGTGKGMAADAAAHMLEAAGAYTVDCSGDVAVGGTLGRTHEILVEHPLTREHVHAMALVQGGVATSGIDRNVWIDDLGRPAHHLLDPRTGRPAWTGLISVTVAAGSVLEAETLAKAALLSGPDAGRRLLRSRAAVLVHDDGDVEVLQPAGEHTIAEFDGASLVLR